MKIPFDILPDEIIAQYNLHQLKHNGFIYYRIQKVMYGIPQAGMIANKLLQNRLAKHEYHPTLTTPGLCNHDPRRTTFYLVIDDFGIKITDEKDVDHLIQDLK